MNDNIGKQLLTNKSTLTEGQDKALIALNKWFKGDSLVFTLYGAAGTGKTYLLKTFLDKYVRYGIGITAPTHKAVRVLEVATERKGKTFQAMHGLRPNFNLDDFNLDNIKYDTIGVEQIGNYRIVVVDECSQISNSAFTLTMNRAKQYKVKILFCGDSMQLPPVVKNDQATNRLSPVFSVEDKFELTEIVRQAADNPLIQPLQMLRLDILRQSNTFLDYIKRRPVGLNNNNEGYICLGLKEFEKSVIDRFKDGNYETNTDYVKYAAWRNININQWNTHLRKILFNNPTEVIIPEDLLVGYTTIVDPSNFMESLITNSSNYVITSIDKRKSDYNFDVYVLQINDGYGTTNTITVVDHKADNYKRFVAILSRLHSNAMYAQAHNRGRYWKEFYDFKNRYLSLVDINLKDSDTKGGTSKKDIDYGYGLTIHKL